MASAETLGYFPTPYPDEDIRSILYRYHMRSFPPYQAFKKSKESLFGYKSNRNSALPRGVGKLIVGLPEGCGITVDSLLKDNTILPLLRPFMDAATEQQVYQQFHGANHQQDNGPYIFNQISEKIKYCPMCIQHDHLKYGEVYLHRIHQIKFILYCPTHRAKLLTKCIKCNKNFATIGANKLLSAPSCDCGNNLSNNVELLINNDQDNIVNQFKIIEWLLNSSHTWDFVRLKKYLYESAWNRGFYKYSGSLDYEVIFKMLSEYFTPSYFESFGYSPTFFTTRIIRSIFLTKNNLYNIFSITSLLIMFHNGVPNNEEEYALPIANILPFGAGPWNCINKKCENNKYATIKKFHKFTTKTFIFKAHFKCDECGMVYSKSWNWDERKYGKENIVNTGMKIEILKLYTTGITIDDIAIMTKRSSVYVMETLQRLLEDKASSDIINKNLELDVANEIVTEINKDKLETVADNEDIKIINHRKILKEFMILNPAVGRTEFITTTCSRSYRYLLKHDREWLMLNLPEKKSKARSAEELDEYFYNKMTIAYKFLTQDPKQYQIKKTSILNKLDSKDRHNYYSHQKKLFRTNELLEMLIESKEDHLVRNVPHIYNQLVASGYRKVTFKNICARNRSYHNLTEITVERIKNVLKKLQEETVD